MKSIRLVLLLDFASIEGVRMYNGTYEISNAKTKLVVPFMRDQLINHRGGYEEYKPCFAVGLPIYRGFTDV